MSNILNKILITKVLEVNSEAKKIKSIDEIKDEINETSISQEILSVQLREKHQNR